MDFNFENYLRQELHSDKIVVLSEQLFAKNGELDPDKIYVITKYGISSIEFGVETQPVQILILSEQNGLIEAKEIFDSFSVTHNWKPINDGVFIKQQYTSPAVMSNFNEAAYGYRSVLYISATLYIMNNISDVENLTINDVPIEPLSFDWSYQMTGNTQPVSSDVIASTVKSIATFQATLSIPVLNNYINEDGFGGIGDIAGATVGAQSEGTYTVDVKKGYKIVATILGEGSIKNIDQETGEISYISFGEASLKYDYVLINLLSLMLKVSNGTLSGNTDFNIKFTVYSEDFNFHCKLIAFRNGSKPNDAPTLQVGLQR